MPKVNIDPAATRQATSSFASQIVLVEGAAAAAQTACVVAAPLVYLISGLDGTLGTVRKTISDIRSDCNNLVRAVNGCCTLYENAEQDVYNRFGGKETLYDHQPAGGIIDTFVANVGNAVRSTIESISSAIENIDWGEFLIEGLWTAVEIAGWVGTIAAACFLAPAAPIVAAIAIVVASGYLINSMASRSANLAAILQGRENPDVDYLHDFLNDKLGGWGDAIYYVGMFIPAILTTGISAFATGSSSTVNAANTTTKMTKEVVGKATGSAPRQSVTREFIKEAGEECLEQVRDTVLEDASKRAYRTSAGAGRQPAAAGDGSGGSW